MPPWRESGVVTIVVHGWLCTTDEVDDALDSEVVVTGTDDDEFVPRLAIF